MSARVIRLATAFALLTVVATWAGDARVGKTAADPSQAGGFVAGMQPAEMVDFMKQVVTAASRLPLPAEQRVSRVAAAIGAILQAAPADARPELLANALATVPFTMLPATVDLLDPKIEQLTGGMDAKAYASFVVAVVTAVDGLDLPVDDKSIVMTFAIVLLVRARPADKQDEVMREALQAVPESYREMVEQMLKSALAGDYGAIFGPTARIVPVAPLQPAPPLNLLGDYFTLRDDVLRSYGESIYIDVGIERPSIPVGEGVPSPSGSAPIPPPPVPPPYLGQWL